MIFSGCGGLSAIVKLLTHLCLKIVPLFICSLPKFRLTCSVEMRSSFIQEQEKPGFDDLLVPTSNT